MPTTGHPSLVAPLQRAARKLMTACTWIAQEFVAAAQRRHAVRVLRSLSDRELRDIGLHRGEIEFVARSGQPERVCEIRHPETVEDTASLMPQRLVA
jgi:uncharacterized protein YjiS (DUF1127 family)